MILLQSTTAPWAAAMRVRRASVLSPPLTPADSSPDFPTVSYLPLLSFTPFPLSPPGSPTRTEEAPQLPPKRGEFAYRHSIHSICPPTTDPSPSPATTPPRRSFISRILGSRGTEDGESIFFPVLSLALVAILLVATSVGWEIAGRIASAAQVAQVGNTLLAPSAFALPDTPDEWVQNSTSSSTSAFSLLPLVHGSFLVRASILISSSSSSELTRSSSQSCWSNSGSYERPSQESTSPSVDPTSTPLAFRPSLDHTLLQSTMHRKVRSSTLSSSSSSDLTSSSLPSLSLATRQEAKVSPGT